MVVVPVSKVLALPPVMVKGCPPTEVEEGEEEEEAVRAGRVNDTSSILSFCLHITLF